jgi:hypothetical protein
VAVVEAGLGAARVTRSAGMRAQKEQHDTLMGLAGDLWPANCLDRCLSTIPRPPRAPAKCGWWLGLRHPFQSHCHRCHRALHALSTRPTHSPREGTHGIHQRPSASGPLARPNQTFLLPTAFDLPSASARLKQSCLVLSTYAVTQPPSSELHLGCVRHVLQKHTPHAHVPHIPSGQRAK